MEANKGQMKYKIRELATKVEALTKDNKILRGALEAIHGESDLIVPLVQAMNFQAIAENALKATDKGETMEQIQSIAEEALDKINDNPTL